MILVFSISTPLKAFTKGYSNIINDKMEKNKIV